jgi:hypothetical protein
MLSQQLNTFAYAQTAMKFVPPYVTLSRKLVTRWLSMPENHFGVSRAFSEFFLSSPCHSFLCPCSLSPVLCTLSVSHNLFPVSHPPFSVP